MGWWTVDFATLGRVEFYTIISVKTKQIHLLTLHLDNHETMARIWLPSVIARSKEERGTRTNSWNAFWPLSVLSFDNHYCYLQTGQYGSLWNKPLQATSIVLFFSVAAWRQLPSDRLLYTKFQNKARDLYHKSILFRGFYACFMLFYLLLTQRTRNF